MITVLADHNIEGQALLLWGTLAAAGWLDLIPLRLVRFAESFCIRQSMSAQGDCSSRR